MAGLESTPAQAIDLSSARYLRIDVPLRKEDLDPEYGSISPGFPGVDTYDLIWSAVVELASGVIQDWPKAEHQPTTLHLVVKDTGRYTLLDENHLPLVRKTGYVPEEVLPDSGGDDIILQLDTHGKIRFWLDPIDLTDFEMDEFDNAELIYPNENGEFEATVTHERATSAEPMTRHELRERRRAERRALRHRRASLEATEAAIASSRRKRQEQQDQLTAHGHASRKTAEADHLDERSTFRF